MARRAWPGRPPSPTTAHPAASSATGSPCPGERRGPRPYAPRAEPGDPSPPDAAGAGERIPSRGRRTPVALQAQVTSPPYVGLWTRLEDFRRQDLTRLMMERRVVRATLMRATLQLMTEDDYLLLRPALQPALTRSMRSIAGKRLEGLDLDRLIGAARDFFEEEPRTFADLRPLLSELEPDRDNSGLAYAVRTRLPLVQVPSGGVWGYSGKPPFTTPERWLGRSPSGSEEARDLILKYLAAFGPATVKDVQTWSGRTQLKPSVEEIRPELRTFRDENGNEL